MALTEEELSALAEAAHLLENPRFIARLTKTVAATVEKAVGILPKSVSASLVETTRVALEKALDGALFTLDAGRRDRPSKTIHKVLAGLSGAFGGAAGFSALAVELPVSTTLMLRSIADIARSEGEDIRDMDTKLACLEVFALGGNKPSEDGSETGYYAVRSLLANTVGESARHIASKGLSKEGAPALVRFLNAVAARFSIPVSEKFAAQALPVLGAVGGASVNLLFMDFFQDLAQAHFTIRRLERLHGPDTVKTTYERLAARHRAATEDAKSFDHGRGSG